MLPYFRRAENSQRAADAYHGKDGPLRVTMPKAAPESWARPSSRRVAGRLSLDARLQRRAAGGLRPLERTTRWPALEHRARYLYPARKRPNLTVVTGALRSRCRSRAVRHRHCAIAVGGERRTAMAEREVILCGGAINCPQLLQLSGIGPARAAAPAGHRGEARLAGRRREPQRSSRYRRPACLQAAGVPGQEGARAGQHLTGLQWFLNKSGAAASNHFEAGGFIRSRAGSSIQICNSPSCRWR